MIEWHIIDYSKYRTVQEILPSLSGKNILYIVFSSIDSIDSIQLLYYSQQTWLIPKLKNKGKLSSTKHQPRCRNITDAQNALEYGLCWDENSIKYKTCFKHPL